MIEIQWISRRVIVNIQEWFFVWALLHHGWSSKWLRVLRWKQYIQVQEGEEKRCSDLMIEAIWASEKQRCRVLPMRSWQESPHPRYSYFYSIWNYSVCVCPTITELRLGFFTETLFLPSWSNSQRACRRDACKAEGIPFNECSQSC